MGIKRLLIGLGVAVTVALVVPGHAAHAAGSGSHKAPLAIKWEGYSPQLGKWWGQTPQLGKWHSHGPQLGKWRGQTPQGWSGH